MTVTLGPLDGEDGSADDRPEHIAQRGEARAAVGFVADIRRQCRRAEGNCGSWSQTAGCRWWRSR